MLDITKCNLTALSAHRIGNKALEYENQFSKSGLDISENEVRELVLKYFLKDFNSFDLHKFFSANDDFSLNPTFTILSGLFDGTRDFHDSSKDLAKFLYESSTHPKIKTGDLYVAYFSNLVLESVVTDAIGIFKVESQIKYLKLEERKDHFDLSFDTGIDVRKLDKGCLVFGIEENSGFRACVFDSSSKANDTQYWKRDFLGLEPVSDDYHSTGDFLKLTKEFISKKFDEEPSVRADLMSRSLEFFRNNDTFDQVTFNNSVFSAPEVIESFKEYGSDYQKKKDIQIPESFEISEEVVKKKSRIFKSVLKLDSNCHIYLHGNGDFIEKGYDSKSGRSFYKIYFHDES